MKYLLLCVLILLGFSSCKKTDKAENTSAFKKQLTNGNLNLTLRGDEILSYATSTRYPADTLPSLYKRSGFVHPLKTLGGVVLTDDFPVGHTHQHGLFTAWTSTTFRGEQIDFWNQLKNVGIVKHKDLKITLTEDSFSTKLEYIAIIEGDSIVALHEEWDVKVSEREDHYIIDWEITQRGNGTDSLTLNKYHYGGPAFRGSGEWNVKNNFDSICYFITNENLNHIDGNHTRPLWASMYGIVNGKMGGVGIIQSKENIRYPQFIRVHPTMPYFCFIPTVEEPFVIGPFDMIKANYRLVIFDGEVNSETMNKEMMDFNSRFETRSYLFDAITDIASTTLRGFAPTYIDEQRDAIAIDATKYKNQFGASSYIFEGESGNYDLKLRALAELDGESKYRIAINDKLLEGIRTNPRIFGTDESDYMPAFHRWQSVNISEGDVIRIESSAETNGKVPEGDITAYSRGRFTSLRLNKVD